MSMYVNEKVGDRSSACLGSASGILCYEEAGPWGAGERLLGSGLLRSYWREDTLLDFWGHLCVFRVCVYSKIRFISNVTYLIYF